MSEPWAHPRTVAERLSVLRFVVLSAGLAVGVVVAIGVEDAARAAVGVIRRSRP